MNPVPFIAAAYAVAALGIGGVIVWSWIAMRRAEAEADRLRGGR